MTIEHFQEAFSHLRKLSTGHFQALADTNQFTKEFLLHLIISSEEFNELSNEEMQAVYRALYREGGKELIKTALATCSHLSFWIEAATRDFRPEHLITFAEETAFEEIVDYFQKCIAFYAPVL